MTPKLIKKLECGVDCILSEECNSPYMKAEGDLGTAEVLFVGEAPGNDEDQFGKPFIGAAGKLLREAIDQIGLTKYVITNAIRCRPPKNRTPSTKEIQVCKPSLMAEIEAMPNLKLIVVLGNVPLQAVTGIKSGIIKYSGKTLDVNGRTVMPILHPAYILRNQDEQGTFFEHMHRIPNAMTGSLVDPADLGTYHVIKTLDEWVKLVHCIWEAKEFAFDLEATGLSPYIANARIKCIGFSFNNKEAYVLPTNYGVFNPWTEDEWDAVVNDLHLIFEAEEIAKIAQNGKFDILWMRHILGIKTIGFFWDTMIVEFLLNENNAIGLKDMAWKYSKLGGYEGNNKDAVNVLEGDELWQYNAIDTDLTYRIYNRQYDKLIHDDDLYRLFSEILLPASIILSEMEERGILIDQDLVQDAIDFLDGKDDKIGLIQEIENEIRHEQSVIDFELETDSEFNPNSHVQLREVLFKYEGLPVIKKTPTHQPSTDLEVLEKLAPRSNLCKLLMKYSSYQTIRSKTLKEFTEAVGDDGRIHTTYWVTQTATGRTSSRKPNLQNLPKGKKDLVKIRRAVIADPEYFFVEFDFNQIELRLAAEVSKDEVMEEAIKTDMHKKTAAECLAKSPEEVTDEDRRIIGKTVNFGTIYGQTKYGLMKKINCTESEADLYISRFMKTYFMFAKYMEETRDQILSQGWVKSPLGRYRRLPVWKYADPNSEAVASMIREAINAPIQSLASDLLLISLIGIQAYIDKNKLKSKLVLEIHDSAILLVHQSELRIISDILNIMSNYFKKFIDIKVPILVDAKYGLSLGAMEEWK